MELWKARTQCVKPSPILRSQANFAKPLRGRVLPLEHF